MMVKVILLKKIPVSKCIYTKYQEYSINETIRNIMFTGNRGAALNKKGIRLPGCLQRSHTQTLLTPVKIPDLF